MNTFIHTILCDKLYKCITSTGLSHLFSNKNYMFPIYSPTETIWIHLYIQYCVINCTNASPVQEFPIHFIRNHMIASCFFRYSRERVPPLYRWKEHILGIQYTINLREHPEKPLVKSAHKGYTHLQQRNVPSLILHHTQARLSQLTLKQQKINNLVGCLLPHPKHE